MHQARERSSAIPLKNWALAGFLAWLTPGLGHLYQGRTAKGLLFMICILGTFVFGMWLGDGRVVYASFRPDDWRLPYLCQVGVGLPALPALLQASRVSQHKAPLFGGRMAPPNTHDPDELSEWQYQLGARFDLGTVYTMVAGLLNVLAIYDALDGPARSGSDEDESEEDERKKSDGPASSAA
jgi:hypothetical protein